MARGRRGASPLTGKRELYRRLMEQGLDNSEACRVVGINRRTGTRWRYGRTYTNRAGEQWVYPAVTAPSPLEVQAPSRFLSEFERVKIADYLRDGITVTEIARRLARSPATISREISRNADAATGTYHPHAAQRAAVDRRRRGRDYKLAEGGELHRFVAERLAKRWSPEQISQATVTEFSNRPEMQVCAETIYQAIYRPDCSLRRCSPRPLRTGRLHRRHRRGEQRTNRFIEPMTNVSERSAEAENREVAGHWEGDLIIGKLNRSAIGTLVERTTRFTIPVHLDGKRTAEQVRDALIETFLELPPHLRRSLTWDQGIEMARHGEFARATGTPVYFCDPASPWQRPTNENTNGLLRDYFPKGTDLFQHSAEHLAAVAEELNDRPRKTLGWQTPASLLATLIDPPRCDDR